MADVTPIEKKVITLLWTETCCQVTITWCVLTLHILLFCTSLWVRLVVAMSFDARSFCLDTYLTSFLHTQHTRCSWVNRTETRDVFLLGQFWRKIVDFWVVKHRDIFDFVAQSEHLWSAFVEISKYQEVSISTKERQWLYFQNHPTVPLIYQPVERSICQVSRFMSLPNNCCSGSIPVSDNYDFFSTPLENRFSLVTMSPCSLVGFMMLIRSP